MYAILVALKLNLKGWLRVLLPLMNGSIRHVPEVGLQSDKIKLGAARVAQSVDGVFLMRFLETSSRAIKGKGHRYSGLKCNVAIYLFLFEQPWHKRSIPCL